MGRCARSGGSGRVAASATKSARTVTPRAGLHGALHAPTPLPHGEKFHLDAQGDPISGEITEWLKATSARCARLLECLPSLQPDPNRTEDLLKVDADEEGISGGS